MFKPNLTIPRDYHPPLKKGETQVFKGTNGYKVSWITYLTLCALAGIVPVLLGEADLLVVVLGGFIFFTFEWLVGLLKFLRYRQIVSIKMRHNGFEMVVSGNESIDVHFADLKSVQWERSGNLSYSILQINNGKYYMVPNQDSSEMVVLLGSQAALMSLAYGKIRFQGTDWIVDRDGIQVGSTKYPWKSVKVKCEGFGAPIVVYLPPHYNLQIGVNNEAPNYWWFYGFCVQWVYWQRELGYA